MRASIGFLLVLMLGTSTLQAQSIRKPNFTEPIFPGGTAAWVRYLNKNINYPTLARQININGRVILEFVVEKDGSVSNVKVTKGLGAGCDEEAVRVVSASPKWTPALKKGKPIRYAFTFPIRFQLSDEEDEEQTNQ